MSSCAPEHSNSHRHRRQNRRTDQPIRNCDVLSEDAARKAWDEYMRSHVMPRGGWDFRHIIAWLYSKALDNGKEKMTSDSVAKNSENLLAIHMREKFNHEVEIYKCAYSEYEVGYMDKTLWCNCRESSQRTCDCGTYTFTQQFCPFFEKGELKGKWKPDERELEYAEKYIASRRKGDSFNV